MRCTLLAFFAASVAFAQLPLSVGLKAGYVNNSNTGSRIVPFKGGPYLELKLPFLPTFETGLMLERYQAGSRSSTVYQVPILVKKRIDAIAIKPFVSGGVTLRRIPDYNDHSGAGLTLAGGVTLGLLPIKIEPELRYTRWLQTDFSPRGGQAELLIGIRF